VEVNMFKMKLVEDWKDGWRWISTRCMALSLAMLGTWEVVPSEWKSSLPDGTLKYLVTALLVLGVFGRFIDQAPAGSPADK
jgi:membrane protein required for beta-lactamase induction